MGTLTLITSVSVSLLFLTVFLPRTCSQVGFVPLADPHVAIFQVYDEQNDALLVDKRPNSTVTFSKNVGKVVLACISAKQPVTWEYFVNGINFTPVLEQSYVRTMQPPDLRVDGDSGYLFQTKVTLRGLLESQSGIYTCKYATSIEGQSQPNNKSMSAMKTDLVFDQLPNYFDIRIPGSHVFLEEQREILVSSNDSSIDIWCQTSNPNFEVTLWKAVPKENGNVELESILINNPALLLHGQIEYENFVQEQIKHGLFSLKNVKASFGRYSCTSRDKIYTIDVKPWNQTANGSKSNHKIDPSKYPNPNYLRILRLKRRRCTCPYEPDISELHDLSTNAMLASRGCAFWEDASTFNWKLAEFYQNGEENCLSPSDKLHSDWPLLRSDKKSWSDLIVHCDAHPDYTNLTIIFHGFDEELARGFRIGIRRLRRTGGLTELEYLNKTPFVHPDTSTLDEPGKPHAEWSSGLGLMKYKWRLTFLNVTRVQRVHLFLPYKYSTEWKSFVASFVNDQPNSRFIYSYTNPNQQQNSISSAASMLKLSVTIQLWAWWFLTQFMFT